MTTFLRFVERSYTYGAGTGSYKLYVPGGYVGQGGPVVARSENTDQGRKILPTIIFRGDGDSTVHPRNGDRILAHLDSADRSGSVRVTTRRGRVPGGYEYTRFTYKSSDGQGLAERWSVHGLGHGPQRSRRLGRDGAFLPAAQEAVAGTVLRVEI